MNILIIISTLFVIGALIGYLLELFFRRFVSGKWINPGFLLGPYLPIYGVGVLLLYGISNIAFVGLLPVVDVILKILLIFISMITIEFVTGLIFIKKYGIKLWDYSNYKGNILGIICPQFSFIWLVIGCLYYFLINPLLVDAITFISSYPIYGYFIGIVIGMILVDFAYSIHLASRLRRIISIEAIRFDEVRMKFMCRYKKMRQLHKPK